MMTNGWIDRHTCYLLANVRRISFVISRSHNTELATPVDNVQSVRARLVVENAFCRTDT